MNIDQIRDAAPGTTLWDKGSRQSIKGLHLRVSPTGTKSFMVFYRTKAGVQRRPKIGEFGEITLAEARTRAKAITDQVAVGLDPKGSWDTSKEELTVSGLFDKTLADYWSQERFVNSKWKESVEGFWRTHLKSRFGSLKLSDVTPMEIRAWHSSKLASPTSANRALEVLSRMFSYAEEVGLREQGKNPCSLVSAYPEKKRSRLASPKELVRILNKFEEISETHAEQVAIHLLILFTGSRPKFVEEAKWSQLKVIENGEVKYGVLTGFGKTSAESGADEVVILPPQALRIIEKLPRNREKMFKVKRSKKFWPMIREACDLGDLWARDFRRTFATIGLSNGVDLGSIGGLLNHKSTETTKIYALHSLESKVRAAVSVANAIDSVVQRERDVTNTQAHTSEPAQ